jgi:DNA-binding transcriptional ArsR family regulator
MKAEIFKALGNPVRLGIVELLDSGERYVNDIVEHVGTDTSNVSKHLSILKKQGIVADRRDGLKVFYRLAMPCTMEFTRCVESALCNRLGEQTAVMSGCGAGLCNS